MGTIISIFEFVLTGFTLLLALVITRLLGGMRWIVAADRVYWVHLLYVLNFLVITSLVWWALWFQREASWTYISFAYNLLIGPGIMYFLAVLLVPERPRRIKSWNSYFYQIRVLFYGAMLGLAIAALLGSLLITQTSLFHPTQAVIFLGIALSLTGLLSDRHVIHAALVITLSVLVGYSMMLASTSSF